ncbi:lipopolysaccharide export system protein LptA [Desulfurobacterium pacificum]|uniref:Lipopolysaccharide export system protein LptA n=1 Tax=Desulfurobacterium pacificum TaxID=240166 RepID=A0ABY1NDS8_9BACT|nr:lipopolysaccharide transport periplasmic protein LptA [Desulfurobacterium pacificum]SMP06804.1 lipopolysaccharide export system protein LptA [Desulfurobacterium pacificum]
MKKIAILVALFLIPLYAAASQPSPQQNLPLVIEARKLTYDDQKKVATYIGHVVAQRGKTVMTGDKLLVFFDKTGKYIEKIEVIGNVHIVDPRGEGWCNTLYYYPAQEKAVLLGNAKLKQGKNVIVGDKIIAYKDGRVIVEGIKQRVKTVIYPGEKSEQAIGLESSKSGKDNQNIQQKKGR